MEIVKSKLKGKSLVLSNLFDENDLVFKKQSKRGNRWVAIGDLSPVADDCDIQCVVKPRLLSNSLLNSSQPSGISDLFLSVFYILL